MTETSSPKLPAPSPREIEIQRIVAAAPPLTADQRDRIRRIIAPVLDVIFAEHRKSTCMVEHDYGTCA